MENRINQIITTTDNTEYMILHQAIYNGENYYVCCGVDEAENLTENFSLLKETKENDTVYVELVEDEGMAKFILKHLNLIDGE